MPGKLIGFKVEPEIAAALDELAEVMNVRSKSALVRGIARAYVRDNAGKLQPETRDALSKPNRVNSRRHYRRSPP